MAILNKFAARIIKSSCVKNSSTATQAVQIQEELLQPFRTKENNPANHKNQHLNRFYTVPEVDVKNVFKLPGSLPNEYQKNIETFAEMSLLIRKPAIELLTYLTRTDFSKPVNKYVIYGDNGCGKSSTIFHILHYGYRSNKVLVHIPWVQKWFRIPQETRNSESKEGYIDLPLDASTWLLHFKNQNSSILAEKDLRLSKSYEWSLRDHSEKDSPLLDMINFGISRVKFACDIVAALISELKQASTSGKCKILVAIDGYNAFYSTETQVKNDDKKRIPACKVSLTEAFLDITKSDWCNGQIILAVDQMATKERRESYFPRYLLTEEGFDHLDPFVPIEVENYSQEEFDSVIAYYKNRKWIRSLNEEAYKELKLLSGYNPYKLMESCKHL